MHQWSLLIDKLEAQGYVLRHEFPEIRNRGILQPIKFTSKLGTPLLSYTESAHYLDLELIAFKIVQQLQKYQLLGSFPADATHFIAQKPASVNKQKKGDIIWRCPIFVVRKTIFEKWCEVQDYSASVSGNSLNDISFHELKHIKYSTVADRCIAYLGYTHGSVLD